MAGRPIKEDGINSNMTNKQIADRYQSLIKEKNEHIKSLEDEIKKLNLELKEKSLELRTMSSEIAINSSDESKIKKILSLYAKNNSHSEIFEKMKYKGYRDIDLDYVKQICDYREELDSDLILYYKQQESAYNEQLKIDSNILKDKLILRYEKLYADAEYDLQFCNTVEEKRKQRDEMNKHLDKLNNVLKNVVEDKDKDIVTGNIINDMIDDYEEQKNKIIKFRVESVKSI